MCCRRISAEVLSAGCRVGDDRIVTGMDTRWILLLVLVLSGCGSRVHVVDLAGRPIVGANLTTFSPSIAGDMTVTTNDQGDTLCPYFIGQNEISISATGFRSTHVDLPCHFPVTITLTPETGGPDQMAGHHPASAP